MCVASNAGALRIPPSPGGGGVQGLNRQHGRGGRGRLCPAGLFFASPPDSAVTFRTRAPRSRL